MEHQLRKASGRLVARTLTTVFVIYIAWVGAWILKGVLDHHVAWIVTSGGRFAYWTTMKLLFWIFPSVVLIRLSGRSLRTVFGTGTLRSALNWGIGAGLVLGVISLVAKVVMDRPLLSLTFSWPQFSGLAVAPVFEEFMFRGAVLGNLFKRYRFGVANTITAALFLGLHLPGWYFQENLWTNLTSPVGALVIFLLGWAFGFVAYRSRSVVASMLTHGLSNLFS